MKYFTYNSLSNVVLFVFGGYLYKHSVAWCPLHMMHLFICC